MGARTFVLSEFKVFRCHAPIDSCATASFELFEKKQLDTFARVDVYQFVAVLLVLDEHGDHAMMVKNFSCGPTR